MKQIDFKRRDAPDAHPMAQANKFVGNLKSILV